jgi:hypothetical protein
MVRRSIDAFPGIYLKGQLDHRLHTVSGPIRAFMFPDPDYAPPISPKLAVGIGIAQPVSLDLLPPPLRVRLRPCAVVGASVPVAAVHEYSDAESREGYVCSSAESRKPVLDTEAETAPMEE